MGRFAPLLVVLALSGCAHEAASSGSAVPSDLPATQEQAVRVALQFRLEDPASIDAVEVEQVFLNVGAVFLDPLDGPGDTAFASRQPLALVFDPAAGDFEIQGPELFVPKAGRYAVSLLLEPGEIVGRAAGKDPGDALSVGIEGRYRAGSVIADEPSPLPWRPKSFGQLQVEDAWHPFAFRSTDAIRMQLAELQLDDGGNYEIAVVVRIDEWMRESVLPAVEAVVTAQERNERPGVEPQTAVVDGSLGNGVELHGLLGDMAVSARRF